MDQKQVGPVLAAVGAVILVSASVLSITSSPDEPLAGDSPILGTTVPVAMTASASSQAPATTVQLTSPPPDSHDDNSSADHHHNRTYHHYDDDRRYRSGRSVRRSVW